MRSSEFFAEAARMTVDAVKALAECFARAFRQAAKAIRKLAKRLDPRWQRRYRRALAVLCQQVVYALRVTDREGHTPEQAIERIGKLTGLIDRATTHLVLDEDGRTCCAKCGCDYPCMSSATYCPDSGAKVAKNG